MKFFIFISLLSATLLGITVQQGWQNTRAATKRVPLFLVSYRQSMMNRFEKPENAAILFSFFTGDKSQVSHFTKTDFKKVNLSFLLSPSGIHFSGLIFLIGLLLKKIKSKRIRRFINITFLTTPFFISSFDAIKRLSILRIIFQLKFFTKIKLPTEIIFLLTFLISAIIGGFSRSPLGFIYSFIFLGTFFSLRDYSKIILIMGLFSTQLILALFMGEKVSLLSIPAGLVLSLFFTFLFPILILFFTTFWLIPFNWGEPLIKFFVLLIHLMARFLNGSFTSSSLFLIGAIWCLMMLKHSKRKCAAVIILIFLHTNTAMTPVQFPPNLPSKS